jgi:von Willebrand factor A domain-containing protein 7
VTRKPALAITVLLAAPAAIVAQQQPSIRAGWPCTARLDPSYFKIAEATGGQLLLLAPEEISDSARLLTAFSSHKQTIFRLAGTVPPGVHEFQVPIDPSVDSVLFSVSVQCLQVADVLTPSGEHAGGDGVTDLSNFRAERMVIAARPQPGVWTIRVAGSGVAGVTVQAKSALALAQVEFAQPGSQVSRAIPWAGVQNMLKLRVSGGPADVHASIVSGGFERLAQLTLEAGEDEGEYLARFTPDGDGIRVLVVGKDASGFAFQRMQAQLLTPMP